MKKLLYVLFALLTFTSAAQAQTAKQILDQTAAKLKKSGGLQATFKVGNFTDGKETGSGSGTIYVKGDKFHIDSPQMKTWFDGKTQWSYLEGSNEVNVSHPTEAELQNINPYTFVNLYKQGYTYSLSHTTLRGKACHKSQTGHPEDDSRHRRRHRVAVVHPPDTRPGAMDAHQRLRPHRRTPLERHVLPLQQQGLSPG